MVAPLPGAAVQAGVAEGVALTSPRVAAAAKGVAVTPPSTLPNRLLEESSARICKVYAVPLVRPPTMRLVQVRHE